jgi:hypothetical protein
MGEHVVLPHVNVPPPPPVQLIALKSAPLHRRSMRAFWHIPPEVESEMSPFWPSTPDVGPVQW